MIPGIDPKVDIAFKKVYGSEAWLDLTVSLVNAVLHPALQGRVVELQLLNPYSEKIALDDKLSILDIKARDDQGRLFNVEMQMVATASLPQRFLYYWAKLYSQQLSEGDDYTKLCPTISICFVNGDLFAGRVSYHSVFRLLDTEDRLCLTDDLALHVIEIPKFTRDLGDLREPLDFWLYFLKNGERLDADALPGPLDTPQIRRAMEILKMFAQNALERELYEGRLKAERDLQTLETQRKTLEAERDQWQQRYVEAQNDVHNSLAKRIQLCERLLGRSVSTSEELAAREVEELRGMADRLEREVTNSA
jgi:predicted transposase/invertase (TIGR01784 family)